MCRIKIENVSLKAFCVALRWARMQGFPDNLNDWTTAQGEVLQAVAKERDRRHNFTPIRVTMTEKD